MREEASLQGRELQGVALADVISCVDLVQRSGGAWQLKWGGREIEGKSNTVLRG